MRFLLIVLRLLLVISRIAFRLVLVILSRIFEALVFFISCRYWCCTLLLVQLSALHNDLLEVAKVEPNHLQLLNRALLPCCVVIEVIFDIGELFERILIDKRRHSLLRVRLLVNRLVFAEVLQVVD